MSLIKLIGMTAICVTLLMAGCAALPPADGLAAPGKAHWHGRLGLRVDSSQAQAQALSFAAGFELVGSARSGALTLFTPLGTTLASLSWSDQSAVLRQGSDSQYFESLDALTVHALGAEIPMAALFAWLAGDAMDAAGWNADLSLYAQGSILARRTQPTPEAEIRLLLEK